MRVSDDDAHARDASTADATTRDERPARRRAAVFNIIRVRGAASSRPVASEFASRRGDDADDGATGAFRASVADDDDDDDGSFFGAANDVSGMTRAHVVRVFARVEGTEKQAIAAYGGGAREREEYFYTRAEACERACAVSCEKAAVGADADDAAELCESACAYACERQSDADGKFEVCLRGTGDLETRRWEEELERRARAAERAIGKNGNGNAPT